MGLKFIDISNWQTVETAGMLGVDGVIVKATQGTWYTSPSFVAQYELARAKGRMLGFYHYAEGGNPVKEAEHFYAKVKPYLGEGVPALDWEAGENASWGNTVWCKAFVEHFHKLSGVWCLIYIQASAIHQVKNIADKCGLWLAGYPTRAASWDIPEFIYNVAPWSTYTLWQFTDGGNLDRNDANVDVNSWAKIARGDNLEREFEPSKGEPMVKEVNDFIDLEAMANAVVFDKAYGDGQERKQNLGKLYRSVQSLVNYVIEGTEPFETLVEEVYAGNLGDGEERKQLLGVYYDKVQSLINSREALPADKFYTVKKGDTLSAIAKAHGTDWKTLAKKNGIANADLIWPGMSIKL